MKLIKLVINQKISLVKIRMKLLMYKKMNWVKGIRQVLFKNKIKKSLIIKILLPKKVKNMTPIKMTTKQI